MVIKKKNETVGRKHSPEKVRQWFAEYHRWEDCEEMYSSFYKMYYGLYDGLSKYYPTFYDYYMAHNKKSSEKHYYEIWRDKQGNRQTIMRPVLDDNDNIVYRVIDENHDISDTIRIGYEEPKQEIDKKIDNCLGMITDKFKPTGGK